MDKQREKLIKLIQGAVKGLLWDDIAELIAEYLLANGVIVPPFKLGQKLYDATEFFSDTCAPEIYELKDDVMYIEKRVGGGYLFTYDGMYIYPEEIGKTVFLSLEDAEKALKVLKGVE